MNDDNDAGQKAGEGSAPLKEGEKPEVKSGGESAEDYESRFKGLQGTLQTEIEEKKKALEEKEKLEKKIQEYEFEKLSEMEKLQVKLKEVEAEKEALAQKAETTAVQAQWSSEWQKLKEEFPNAAALPIVRDKAEKNPGALGDPNAPDFDGWVTSVREELRMTEEGLKGSGQDPDFKKIDNQNSSSQSKAELYEGLSPEEKLKRMREDLGVKSSW